MHYTTLSVSDPSELIFGLAPNPVTTRSGMVIGGGTVYPELNFTLPSMHIDAGTMSEVRRNYEQIIEGALKRAADLEVSGVVIEFETLPPMTEHPAWGLEIAKVLLEGMQREKDRSGLKSVLRMTPNDNREFERPPLMRRGGYWDAMLELFERSAAAGAELLSIESVGGKELHDEALVNGDLAGSIFSLCILGERDISIEAILQKEPVQGETTVPIILLTHRMREKQMNAAIEQIEALETIHGEVVRIRLESLDAD